MKLSSFVRRTVAAAATIIATFLSLAHARADAPKFLWVQHAGSPNPERPLSIAVDEAGNSYLVGRFSGPSLTLGSNTLAGCGLFVAKYGPNGNVLWARKIGSIQLCFNSASGYWNPKIATDNAGNTYVLATFVDTMGLGTTTLSPAGTNDFFLAKYDSSGGLVWARTAGPNAKAAALSVDGTGSSFVTGVCGSESLGTTNFTDAGTLSIFTAKFDAAGKLVWINGTPGPGSQHLRPTTISLGPSGSFHVCGEFYAPTLPFGSFTLTNTGMNDVFVARYDAVGNVLWARQGSGTNNEVAMGLAVDATGACYLAGGNASFPSVPSPVSFDDCNLTDTIFFLVKYDPDGRVVWCRKNVVVDVPYPWGPLGWVLATTGDAQGNSYVLGQFESVATFGTITVTNLVNPAPPSHLAANFLAKYDSDGHALWVKQFGGVWGGYTEGWGLAADSAGNCSVASHFIITNAIFDDFTLAAVGGFNDEDVFVARLPAEPPRLTLQAAGSAAVMSWPTNQPGFVLECANELPATNGWTTGSNTVTVVGAENFVTNSVTAGSQFFRLRKQ